ncbi:MAG: hypothetical protein ACPLHI_10860 [Pseudothermotoga sp.]
MHVLCVSPGPTKTRFFERAFKSQDLRIFGNLMDHRRVMTGALALKKGNLFRFLHLRTN